jgi:hypothetical protein
LFRCWVQYRNLGFRISVWIGLSGGGLNGLLPVEMDPFVLRARVRAHVCIQTKQEDSLGLLTSSGSRLVKRIVDDVTK